VLEARQIVGAPAGQIPDRPPSTPTLISNQLVKLYATYLGRGPTRSRATLTADLLIVTFGETMTRAEQHLVAAGEADAVQSMRHTFHRATRQQAIDIVERTLQRTVESYLADIDTQANIALLAFVLTPTAPDNGLSAHAAAR
jgi:uncharacterized protein YbcI